MIAIISESANEIRSLLEKVSITNTKICHNATIHMANVGGDSFLIVVTGDGKVNLTLGAHCATMLYDVDRLIGVGDCAALKCNGVAAGDIGISARAIQYDIEYTALDYVVGELPEFNRRWFVADPTLIELARYAAGVLGLQAQTGNYGSADRFLASCCTANRLRSICHADFADCETAPIGQFAYLMNIPFVYVKGVANYGNCCAAQDYYKNRNLADKNASSVVHQMLLVMTKPSALHQTSCLM